MNRNNFIYAAIITGSLDTLKEQLVIKLGAVSSRLEE